MSKKKHSGIVEEMAAATSEFVQAVRSKGDLVAKKDFEIHQNEYHREIKAGEDISDVPECYIPNLKTEGVL